MFAGFIKDSYSSLLRRATRTKRAILLRSTAWRVPIPAAPRKTISKAAFRQTPSESPPTPAEAAGQNARL